MTRIYLVRHAEAEGNLYRRIHGQYNSLITENGYQQIAALEERFRNVPVDAVYSSDLFRTMTTAGAIYQPKGLPLFTHPGLREINMGIWEDYSWGQAAQIDGPRLKRFNDSSLDWSIEGGETFQQLQDRIYQTVTEIAEKHRDETVVIVTHGMAIRSLLTKLHGLPLEKMQAVPHSDNTAVTCLEVQDELFRILYENDNSHLSEKTSTFAHQKWWQAKEGSLAETSLWFKPLDLEQDGALYYNCRKEAWLTIHGTLEHFDGPGFLNAAKAQAAYDPSAVQCGMVNGEMAGLIQLNLPRDADKGIGGIPFYYMAPQWRSQGIGVQLLGQAVSTYRKLGRTALRLRCAPENTVAQHFYQKHGFHKVGEEQGSAVPLDIMEKYIGY